MPCCVLPQATRSVKISTYDKMAREPTTSLKVKPRGSLKCVSMDTVSIAEKLSELFTTAGYDVVENKYIHKETTNIKEGICVPRVFIQGKFTKSFHCQVELPAD